MRLAVQPLRPNSAKGNEFLTPLRGKDYTDKKNKYMSMHIWVAALARYQIAAHVVGEWDMLSSQCHLDMCLRVGEQARARGKAASVGMTYDEVARRQWSELSRANTGFDVNEASRKIAVPANRGWVVVKGAARYLIRRCRVARGPGRAQRPGSPRAPPRGG